MARKLNSSSIDLLILFVIKAFPLGKLHSVWEYLLRGLNWFLMWSNLILLTDKVDFFLLRFFFMVLFFAFSMSLLSSFLFHVFILSRCFNDCLDFLTFFYFFWILTPVVWFYCLWSTLYTSLFYSPDAASSSCLGFFFHFLRL